MVAGIIDDRDKIDLAVGSLETVCIGVECVVGLIGRSQTHRLKVIDAFQGFLKFCIGFVCIKQGSGCLGTSQGDKIEGRFIKGQIEGTGAGDDVLDCGNPRLIGCVR
ncbi:hypothetical protein SDC9_44667 [bioreactor metagenome]|uniref:Uncharacterized protein n=1 Tax=bioreactor metagenome TaxID=1076179 RepID=A0A644W792_9ZZZZ